MIYRKSRLRLEDKKWVVGQSEMSGWGKKTKKMVAITVVIVVVVGAGKYQVLDSHWYEFILHTETNKQRVRQRQLCFWASACFTLKPIAFFFYSCFRVFNLNPCFINTTHPISWLPFHSSFSWESTFSRIVDSFFFWL